MEEQTFKDWGEYKSELLRAKILEYINAFSRTDESNPLYGKISNRFLKMLVEDFVVESEGLPSLSKLAATISNPEISLRSLKDEFERLVQEVLDYTSTRRYKDAIRSQINTIRKELSNYANKLEISSPISLKDKERTILEIIREEQCVCIKKIRDITGMNHHYIKKVIEKHHLLNGGLIVRYGCLNEQGDKPPYSKGSDYNRNRANIFTAIAMNDCISVEEIRCITGLDLEIIKEILIFENLAEDIGQREVSVKQSSGLNFAQQHDAKAISMERSLLLSLLKVKAEAGTGTIISEPQNVATVANETTVYIREEGAGTEEAREPLYEVGEYFTYCINKTLGHGRLLNRDVEGMSLRDYLERRNLQNLYSNVSPKSPLDYRKYIEQCIEELRAAGRLNKKLTRQALKKYLENPYWFPSPEVENYIKPKSNKFSTLLDILLQTVIFFLVLKLIFYLLEQYEINGK